MTHEELARFLALRVELFDAIRVSLEEDGHCKSYEGLFNICFPNYFDHRSGDAESWGITLDCYLIGPNRHYTWSGATFADVLERCETDVRAWIDEAICMRDEINSAVNP